MTSGNLGQAFTHGFMEQKAAASSTRLAAARSPVARLPGNASTTAPSAPDFAPDHRPARGPRRPFIYSGGDDVFVVGAWDDVIESSGSAGSGSHEFTQGKLTVIGWRRHVPDKPSPMARGGVGDLPNAAKVAAGTSLHSSMRNARLG